MMKKDFVLFSQRSKSILKILWRELVVGKCNDHENASTFLERAHTISEDRSVWFVTFLVVQP